MGFEGFVISDWAGIDEIPGDYKSDIVTSVNAGMDMVMVSGEAEPYKKFMALLTEAIEEELLLKITDGAEHMKAFQVIRN